MGSLELRMGLNKDISVRATKNRAAKAERAEQRRRSLLIIICYINRKRDAS
jgi:hypothetical protein